MYVEFVIVTVRMMELLIIVVFVIMMLQMIVFKTVLAHGEELQY